MTWSPLLRQWRDKTLGGEVEELFIPLWMHAKELSVFKDFFKNEIKEERGNRLLWACSRGRTLLPRLGFGRFGSALINFGLAAATIVAPIALAKFNYSLDYY